MKNINRRQLFFGGSLLLLLAGISASFFAVQNRVDIRNRAAELSCAQPQGKCEVKGDGFSLRVVEIAEDGTVGQVIATGSSPVIYFLADPGKQYRCEVEDPKDATCKNSSDTQKAPFCEKQTAPTDKPAETPIPPTETNKQSCACATDGGILDCADRHASYPGDEGPGLIIINPKYSGPACFSCKELIVKDDDGKEIGRYDCSKYKPGDELLLPTPTGVRLHEAKGEACRTYTVSVLAQGDNQKEQVCGNCSGTVCCPVCKPPVKTGCGTFKDDKGTEFTCDFDIQPSCGSIKKTTKVTILGDDNLPHIIDFDDNYKPSDGDTHMYDNAGTYDVSLTCYSKDYPSDQSSNTCTQRITVGCEKTPSVPPPSSPPTGPGNSPIPTPQPSLCPQIKVVESVACYQ